MGHLFNWDGTKSAKRDSSHDPRNITVDLNTTLPMTFASCSVKAQSSLNIQNLQRVGMPTKRKSELAYLKTRVICCKFCYV